MSEQENKFLDKMECRNRELRALYTRIILGLTIAVLGFVIGFIAVPAVNSNEISDLKIDLKKIENNYVDKEMFSKLVRSFEAQTNILIKIDNREIESVKEVQKFFNEIRNEIIWDIKPSNIRSGKLKN